MAGEQATTVLNLLNCLIEETVSGHDLFKTLDIKVPYTDRLAQNSTRQQDGAILLPVLSPSSDRFSEFFTVTIKSVLKIPPHRECVATLPREILILTLFDSVVQRLFCTTP